MATTEPAKEKPRGLRLYLCARGAAEAMDFYKRAFGAKELFRLTDPGDGRIGHAEMEIGGSVFMISDEYPDFGALSPASIGGCPIKLMIYVEDADCAFAQAIEAGAMEVRPVKDQFFGDRSGLVQDPYGYAWFIAAQVKDVSPQEMQAQWNAGAEG